MEEQLISEETAILAKEKGFDIDTYRKFFECTDGSFEEASRHDFIHDHVVEVYNRPTQSLLQKWLRENYNIDLQAYFIEYRSNGRLVEINPEDRTYAYRIYRNGTDVFIWSSEPELNTYEDALEGGLQQALKSM